MTARPSGGPGVAIGPRAVAVSVAALVLAAPTALWLAGSAVVNTAPTSGSTYVEPDTVGPATGGTGFVTDGAIVAGRSGVEVEVQDDRIGAAYYLDGYLLHGLGLLLVALVVVVAVGVLRRRPVGRPVAAVLVLVAASCVVTAVAVPRARLWAMRETIERYGLPTTLDEARAAGADFHVVEPSVEAYAWTSGFLGAAVLGLGAALWVLHVRGRLRHG